MDDKKKALTGISVGAAIAVLMATGKMADFAHHQLGFVRAEDVAEIKEELRAVNAQLELLIAIYEGDRKRADTPDSTGRGDTTGGQR